MGKCVMEDCIFCKIVAKTANANIIYEDDNIVVFPDLHPKAKTHLLIVPKRHINSLLELSQSDNNLITHMILHLPKIAQQVGVKGFRTIINTGREGGQQVDHLHLHLLAGNLQIAS